MSGTLGLYSLAEEIDRLAGTRTGGRHATTLIKSPRLRVVLISMEAGVELKEHTAPGPITIQPLRGRFTATVEGIEHPLEPESLLAIDAEIRHTVRADETGVFLLTIVWSGDASHVTDEDG